MTPGYKQTDVGVIPEKWGVYRLGDLLQGSRSIRYGIVQPGKFEANGCFMLRSQDYSKGWAGPDGMHKVSAQLENQYRNARIRRDDLVMTVVGAGIGQVVIVPDWLDGTILSRSTARIAIDKDKAAPSFVKAFLESPVGKRQILDCQKEGAQPVVSCPDLAKFFVAGPPLPEQRAIAEVLSDVDALLRELDRLIAKKRNLKQAAMQQLLTGQTRLPGFHGKWEVKRLGDVAEIVMGQSPSSSNYNTSGAGLPLIQGNADIKDRKTITRIFTTQITKRGKSGDILMSVRAPVGEISRAGFDVCLGRGVCAIRFDNDFMYHCLIYLEPTWAKHSKGSTFDSVNSSDVKAVELNLPTDQAEQTAIAKVLSEMDAELAGLEQRREKTRALKQGMMQELLTGRTRLISPKESHA